jgi:hypothetical protein
MCRILGHAARDVHYHNQGMDFSLCMRCATDLIRREGDDWQTLPRGTRVAWQHTQQGNDSASVAVRMRAPPPRRHLPRPMRQGSYDMRQRGREGHVGAELIRVCGQIMLAGIADRWRTPAGDGKAAAREIIYLPAPPPHKANARSRVRSRRAWWLARSAQPSRVRDR